jgi:hypothetical protein
MNLHHCSSKHKISIALPLAGTGQNGYVLHFAADIPIMSFAIAAYQMSFFNSINTAIRRRFFTGSVITTH